MNIIENVNNTVVPEMDWAVEKNLNKIWRSKIIFVSYGNEYIRKHKQNSSA